jgi:hypothetical protein
MNRCTDILIAGYSFSDRHVNMAIRHCRRYRPDVRTYIIQKNDADDPVSFYYELIPNLQDAISPGEITQCEKIPANPTWWKIPSNSKLNTSPVFLWLRGFDKFCIDVVNNGLPA